MRLSFGRPVAAAILVAYWVFMTLVTEVPFDVPGGARLVGYDWAVWSVGWLLAFAAGLYVARWWLLSAVLTPVAVLAALEVSGHQGRFESSGPPLSQYLWWPLGWILFWFFVLPLGLGVSVRRGLGERRVTGNGSGASGLQRGPGTPLNS